MEDFEANNEINLGEDDSVLDADPNTTRWVQYTFWGFVGLAVLLFIALSALAFTQKPEVGTQASGDQQASVLLSLSPEVTHKQSAQAEFEPVQGQIPIDEGDEIKTSQEGQAMLLYPNGTLTSLQANTHVAVEQLQDGGDQSRLALLAGGLWSRVEETLSGDESYEVESNRVVTSVRGTEFSLEKTGADMDLDVVSDEVALASVSSADTNEELTTVLSGEKLEFNTGATSSDLDADIRNLDREQMRQLIREHDQVTQQLNTGDLQRLVGQVQGRLIPTDSQSFTTDSTALERIGESVSGLLVQNSENRAEHFLTLAEERLAEAQRSAAAGDQQGVAEATDNYQNMIGQAVRAAAKSGDTDIQQLVTESTRAHQKVLDGVEQRVPETAKARVQLAQNIAEGGHTEALKALASSSPEQAQEEAISSMRSNLRSAQSESVVASDRDLQNKLREYDRIQQVGSNISDRESDSQVQHADQLRKSLSVIETVDSVSDENLSPGSSRVIDDARDRTIRSQQATLANLAQKDPQQAADVYGKTSEMYLNRLSRGSDGTSSDEAITDAARTYTEYAQFGEEMSRLAAGQGPQGTTSTRELVSEATSQHTEVLQRVQERVPESAQSALQQAVTASENINRPQAEAGADINPQQFAQEKQQQRPQGELQAPAVDEPEENLPDNIPSDVSPGGDQAPDEAGQGQQPESQGPGEQPQNTGQDQQPGSQGSDNQPGQSPTGDQQPNESNTDTQPTTPDTQPTTPNTNEQQNNSGTTDTQPTTPDTDTQTDQTNTGTNDQPGAANTGSSGTDTDTTNTPDTGPAEEAGPQTRSDRPNRLSFLQSGLSSLISFIR